jgi:hypothetical protein
MADVTDIIKRRKIINTFMKLSQWYFDGLSFSY